jgi:hypothetical protein
LEEYTTLDIIFGQNISKDRMDFYIKLKNDFAKSNQNLPIQRNTDSLSHYDDNVLHIIGNNTHTKIDQESKGDLLTCIIGDPIYHSRKKEVWERMLEGQLGSFVRDVDGFYYIIQFSSSKCVLYVSSSLFNILPIYYSNKHGGLTISSSFKYILESIPASDIEIDKQHYLEKALFNFPFTTRTPVDQIKTIPTNCTLRFDGSLNFVKHTHLFQYFTQSPKSWKSSLDEMSDAFIDSALDFLPKSKFGITLTGGLDGRTLVSIARSN